MICGGWRPHRLACPSSGDEAEDQSEGKIVEHNPDEAGEKYEGSDTKPYPLLHICERPVPKNF